MLPYNRVRWPSPHPKGRPRGDSSAVFIVRFLKKNLPSEATTRRPSDRIWGRTHQERNSITSHPYGRTKSLFFTRQNHPTECYLLFIYPPPPIWSGANVKNVQPHSRALHPPLGQNLIARDPRTGRCDLIAHSEGKDNGRDRHGPFPFLGRIIVSTGYESMLNTVQSLW
jgi:hypothetical protein